MIEGRVGSGVERVGDRSPLPLFVSMKKGLVSTDGRQSVLLSLSVLWSNAHVSMASSAGGSGEIGTFARGRMSEKGRSMPPDEKRRLGERTPHLE